MPREPLAQPSDRHLPAPVRDEARHGTPALQAAGEPALQWLERSLAAQVSAFKTCTQALQAAADQAVNTTEARKLLEVRDTLLAIGLEALSRWQTETLDAWYALHHDLAGAWSEQATAALQEWAAMAGVASGPGLEAPAPLPGAQGAQAPGDAAWRQWQSLWALWQTRPEAAQ
ncbi:hypothetical protein [Azohydromonas caseinilytica]|uniref:Phasin protein n=1 Tax=Azohydromonas caseinilytica TaxID=2728836 RepID=A0A848FDZ6_9BURK|nr:hypothetical protein [Azohydromonas caseinilytica]NML17664.1 hypothetical protein [Azohydromonas caseinilytica]